MPEIWTIQKVLNWTKSHFEQKNIPDARLSAELLLANVLKCKRLELYLNFERILTKSELAKFKSFIHRRLKSEPVQYILGETEFMGLPFFVNEKILIPRPETELLVEEALAEIKKFNSSSPAVLDVGTGSGAIAVSLASFAKSCRITAVDLSGDAIETARKNAQRNNIDSIQFHTVDAMDLNSSIGKFDLIVTNPPYIGENEKHILHPQVISYEPEQALFAGEDGLDFYRRFLPLLPEILAEDGVFLTEIGSMQGNQVKKILQTTGFNNITVIPDYQKYDRIVKAKR